ncbi:MAG TPA: YciI family protein [Terrimicrobiaceae bacterium]
MSNSRSPERLPDEHSIKRKQQTGHAKMKYMMMVKADKDYETGAPPNPKLMAAIGKLSEEMTKAGVLLETGGLLPSSMGARVQVARGKLTVTDGPFSESKELIGGYAILEAGSKEEAVELGKTFMKAHADVLGSSYEGELEIRQMFDSSICAGIKG